jgi:hypothetical protein
MSTSIIWVVLFELTVFGMFAVVLRGLSQLHEAADKRGATAEKQRADMLQVLEQILERTPAIAPVIEPPPTAVRYVVSEAEQPTPEAQVQSVDAAPEPMRWEIPPPPPTGVIDTAPHEVADEADPDETLVANSLELVAASTPETDDEEPIAGRTIKGGFEVLNLRRQAP